MTSGAGRAGPVALLFVSHLLGSRSTRATLQEKMSTRHQRSGLPALTTEERDLQAKFAAIQKKVSYFAKDKNVEMVLKQLFLSLFPNLWSLRRENS